MEKQPLHNEVRTDKEVTSQPKASTGNLTCPSPISSAPPAVGDLPSRKNRDPSERPPEYSGIEHLPARRTTKDGYLPLADEWNHLLGLKAPQPPTSTAGSSHPEAMVHGPANHPQQQYVEQHNWQHPAPDEETYSLDEFNSVHVLNTQRQEALAEVDNAKFSRFHARVCLMAGVGFFTDAYDIFVINIASVIIGSIYGTSTNDQHSKSLTHAQDFGIKMATQIGILVGQLLFGCIADVAGRKRMYGIELLIIIFSTLAQALSGSSADSGSVNIVAAIIIWRFLMGIGIGGDYPLSAIITSEFAPAHIRGRLMAVVFSSQGWGQLTGSIIALIVIHAFGVSINQNASVANSDRAWRLLIGLGCVPGVLALYFRFTIPETPRFTMDITRNVTQAIQDIENYLKHGEFFVDPDATIEKVQARTASKGDFVGYFSRMENFKILFGAAYSWFAIDFSFYGLTLNSSVILQSVGWNTSLEGIAKGNLILTAAGQLPGYFASILLIDRVGRKFIQYLGFAALVVIFLIMGAGFKAFANHGPTAFVFMFCLANFFQNFGPNTTTFIVPAEAFPTRYRSTAHGIAAASGKLGAILAQAVVFATRLSGSDADGNGPEVGLAADNLALQILLIVCAAVMVTGLASTWLIPETKNRTLEDISNEDQESFITGPPKPRQRPMGP